MYVKIFDRILDSSIWDEADHVRIAWIAFLVMADADGVVRGTPASLARRANITTEQMIEALAILTAPDPQSTTPDEDGKRLELVSPNLYLVVNKSRYSDMANADTVREQTRNRVRRHREETKAGSEKAVTPCNDPVTVGNGDVTECNATVTPGNGVKRFVTPYRYKDKDRDLEQLRAGAREENQKTEEKTEEKAEPKAKAITLDRSKWRFVGITEQHRKRWKDAYPLVDLEQDIAAAEAWCAANPPKAPKSQHERFLAAWLKRTQDRIQKSSVAKGAYGWNFKSQDAYESPSLPPMTPPSKVIEWKKALKLMAARMPTDKEDPFGVWIRPLEYIGDKGDDVIVLFAVDAFSAQWVAGNYDEQIRNALFDVMGRAVRVMITWPDAEAKSETP